MPNLRGSEWLIIILLVVLLFGAKRLPDAARSIGRSLRIFKAETKGLVDDAQAPAPGAPAVTGAPAGALDAPKPATGAGAPRPVPGHAQPQAQPEHAQPYAQPQAQHEPAPSALAPQGDAGSALHPEAPSAPAPGQPQA
jgi:sec-independent protein translocase protein TatA